MSTIVVMPGGFHPFHAGHAALYNSARRAFPGAEVYVAATNDTSTRPFPFAIKEKLAQLAGVEPGHFVQVKSPFQAREITANFNPEVDRLIFVRSEKDATKPPQAGGVKKDGNPAYLQPLLGATKLEPFGRHAYMAYLPTVEFGPGMTSATEIRTAWPQLNDKRKTALVMSLYPKAQANPALAANVVKMLDTAMGTEELNEFAPNGFDGFEDDDRVPMHFVVEKDRYNRRSKWKKSYKPEGGGIALFTTKQEAIQAAEKYNKLDPNREFAYGGTQLVHVDDDDDDEQLDEFAPDEGGGARKFIPWPEFIEQVKQIVGKDFDCVENVVKTTIKARFVPHDPMEFGPTMLYSYYETRAGRKGAHSTRGAIQVGKYTGGGFTGQIKDKLLTTFSLLKGHPFERHFDLTFDNIYKVANIILGNTQGALEFKPEGVAEASALSGSPGTQGFVGGMYATYQDKENQPVSEDYLDEISPGSKSR